MGNWTVSGNFFNGTGFDPATGDYTVPESGRYTIKAVISYNTTAAVGASIGGNVNPAFVVRKKSPTTTDLVSGLFPVLNISVTLLTLRAVLGNGTVTLTGDVMLNAGDVIGLYYQAEGLNINLNLGGSSPSGTVWSVHKLAD
ncbi:hypothetical protein FFL34_06480 [Lentibacillus cibarius]|uniref:C1q domain-containing protein n=1 Tax=Lentibacillus cibarius TaxID=2583219 RepID=A0A5S3QMU2_9BACI|nr:hypothetical protein FFL34_06480 [Lentibacillus cibarius]